MLESPSSSVGSLDPASPRMRAGDNNGGFYVTMTPLNSNSKVSVSFMFRLYYKNESKYRKFETKNKNCAKRKDKTKINRKLLFVMRFKKKCVSSRHRQKSRLAVIYRFRRAHQNP